MHSPACLLLVGKGHLQGALQGAAALATQICLHHLPPHLLDLQISALEAQSGLVQCPLTNTNVTIPPVRAMAML